jgi:peptide/nickel transport system substrate-binding protein
MPVTAYWDIWTECDLGITPWAHRPLATIVLGLAYTADEEGKPVPWNETRWVDDEFSALLKEAEGTLDLEERRKIMGKLERIQMERGSICIAYWMNVWSIANVKVQNLRGHPTGYDLFTDIWIK